MEKCLDDIQNVKKLSLKETGPSQDQKLVFSRKPRQNIWNKIEKSSKAGQLKKSLLSTFACFWTAIAKV